MMRSTGLLAAAAQDTRVHSARSTSMNVLQTHATTAPHVPMALTSTLAYVRLVSPENRARPTSMTAFRIFVKTEPLAKMPSTNTRASAHLDMKETSAKPIPTTAPLTRA